MNWYIAKLRFTEPVRFGDARPGVGLEGIQPFLHSDTLFSALCNVWVRHGIVPPDELAGLGSIFNASPPFRLSSAFPYARHGTTETFYLPKPLMKTDQFDNRFKMREDQRVIWKKFLKNARFVPADIWQQWLDGERFVHTGYEEKLTRWQHIYSEDLRAHHAQDRLTAASMLYFQNYLRFENHEIQQDCGLYILVNFPEDNSRWLERLQAGLQLLAQCGIGGERNTGKGRFSFDPVKGHGYLKPVGRFSPLKFLNQPAPPDAPQCLFSLFVPTAREQQQLANGYVNTCYSLIHRKGWTFSRQTHLQMKRQSIYCFGEGSVFRGNNFLPQGELVNCQPDSDFPHPVWRNGLALSVAL